VADGFRGRDSDGTTSIVLSVKGMTCRSCEVRIERHVAQVPGVARVKASAVHGQVEITASGPIRLAEIERAIRLASYEVGRSPWIERDPKIWATAAAGVMLLAAVVLFGQVSGLSDLASGVGDLGQGGLVVALLLGLAAGVSTCMALVGGLVLAVSASFQAAGTDERRRGSAAGRAMRPALVFMAGRIAGYAVLGAALGALGATITIPRQLTAILMIVVAVVMTILGTRLTGLSPRIAGWSPTLPRGLGSRLGLEPGRAGAYSDGRAAALGAATFFLPCGFTQAVQIYALSTGSPVVAAAVLAAFAIGTAPGLLALAGLPIVVPSAWRPTLLRLVGVVVVGFAVVNVTAAFRLSGFRFPGSVVASSGAVGTIASTPGVGPGAAVWSPSPVPPAASAASGGSPVASRESPAPVLNGPVGGSGPGVTPTAEPTPVATPKPTLPAVQELRTYQDEGGYGPADAVITAGLPTKWHVDSRSQYGCSAYIVVPSLNIEVALQAGDNVIDLPALPAGKLDYTCAMGMYYGLIAVEPAGASG
jgi:uncharacterized protein